MPEDSPAAPDRWTIVRRFCIAGGAVWIYDSDGRPMTPHWAFVVDSSVQWHGRSNRLEGFDVALYSDDGVMLEWLQYETLEIALDQACELLGIKQYAWEVCEIDLGPPVPE